MRLNELPPEINIIGQQKNAVNASNISTAKCSIGDLKFDIGYSAQTETVVWTNIGNKFYDNIKDIFIENGKLKISFIKDEPEVTNTPTALTINEVQNKFPELTGPQRPLADSQYSEMFAIIDTTEGKALVKLSFETKTGIIQTIEIDGTPYDDPIYINFDENHNLIVKVKEDTEKFDGPNFN